MIPIALFVYNRPAHTQKVLAALKKNKIELLYVFSDAAGGIKDRAKVDEVRSIIQGIDWVEVRLSEQKTHQGLAGSIVGAVNTVLEKYDKIITLEDDCVVSDDFYYFMCGCLDYYEAYEEVFCVSGFLYPFEQKVFIGYPYDVFFWQRFLSSGFGTWRRAWQKYNSDLEFLLKSIKTKGLNIEDFGKDMPCIIQQCRNGSDTWATKWFLTMLLNNGFVVFPVHSRIKNIGFDGSGMHCVKTKRYDVNLQPDAKRELRLPTRVTENERIVKAMVDFINAPYNTYFYRLKQLFKRLFIH